MDLGQANAKKPHLQATCKEIICYNYGKKGHFAHDYW